MKKSYVLLLILFLLFATAIGLAPNILRIEKIQSDLTSRLSREFNSTITAEKILWHWFPMPHISLLNTQFANRVADISLPEMEIYPSFQSFFPVEVTTEKILLRNPRISVTTNNLEESGFEPVLPSARFIIEKGTLLMTQGLKIPGNVISNPVDITLEEAVINTSSNWLNFSFNGSASFCDSFTVSGKFYLPQNHYNIWSDLQGLELHKAFTSFAKGKLLPMAPKAYFSGRIKGSGSDQITARLAGNLPSFLFKPNNHKLFINSGFSDITFDRSGQDYSFKINRMEAKAPALNLEGVIARKIVTSSDDPIWHIDLKGKKLDLSAIRKGVTTLWGDNITAITVCDIVLGGQAKSASYYFDGPASHFQDIKAMIITADVATAPIHVPEANLSLTQAAGPITIEDGILSGHGLTAKLGNSLGRNGSLLVGLTDDNDDFQLNIDIDADLNDLPPTFHKLIKNRNFLDELDLFNKITGTASGNLEIGDSFEEMDVHVTVKTMQGKFHYNRLPWLISVSQGNLTVLPKKVEWTGVKATIGSHIIQNSGGKVTWSNEPRLTLYQTEATVDSNSLFTLLSSKSLLPGDIKKYISAVKGSLLISNGSLSGPAMAAEQWEYSFQTEAGGVRWNSPLLPEPITIESGSAHISHDELMLLGGKALLLNQSFSFDTVLKHSLFENWTGTLNLNGTVKNSIGDWLEGTKWIPPPFLPRMPFTLEDFNIAWGTDTIHLEGGVRAGTGAGSYPFLDLDLIKSPEGLSVKNFSLITEKETGTLSIKRLNAVPRKTRISWDGVLSAGSIKTFFTHNIFQTGRIYGDWQLEYHAETGPTFYNGNATVENLKWTWNEESEANAIFNTNLRGTGSILRVENMLLNLDSTIVTMQGSVSGLDTIMEVGLTLNSPSLSQAQTELFRADLERKIKTLLASPQDIDIRHTLLKRQMHGTVGFDIGSYASSIKIANYFSESQQAYYSFEQLQGLIEFLPNNKTATHVENGILCGLNINGSLYSEDNIGQNKINIHTTAGTEHFFQDILPCLGIEQDLLEGVFTLTGSLNGKPGNWKSGILKIHSTKGRFLRMKLLSKIFGVLNITDIFTSSELSQMKKKGFAYSEMELETLIKKNRLDIYKAIIRGEGLNLFGKGELDLESLDSDFVVLVAPLKSIDKLVGMVPLVGKAVGGENTALVSVPVGIKGNLNDPQITILPPQAVGEAVTNLVTETLKLPFKILTPILPKVDPTVGTDSPKTQ